jgi:MraZ protein
VDSTPLFSGTFTNKRDKKGRVSVPAGYRAVLAKKNTNLIVAFPSFVNDSIVCFDPEFQENVARSLEKMARFSLEHDDLAAVTIGSTAELAIDPDGRIIFPEHLTTHAHITDQVAFIGYSDHFLAWAPERLQAYMEDARRRVKERKISLRFEKQAPAGSSGATGGAA